jgi:hypothetical protein
VFTVGALKDSFPCLVESIVRPLGGVVIEIGKVFSKGPVFRTTGPSCWQFFDEPSKFLSQAFEVPPLILDRQQVRHEIRVMSDKGSLELMNLQSFSST